MNLRWAFALAAVALALAGRAAAASDDDPDSDFGVTGDWGGLRQQLKDDGWTVERLEDGTTRWTSPRGRTYDKPPDPESDDEDPP